MSFNFITSRARSSRALLLHPSSSSRILRPSNVVSRLSWFRCSSRPYTTDNSEADTPADNPAADSPETPKRRGRPSQPKAEPSVPKIRKKSGPKPKVAPPEPEDKTILPPKPLWQGIFTAKQVKDRVSISDPDAAALVADAFVPAGHTGKIIIEAFPGPGQLTRALLNLPHKRISKLIVLESDLKYLQYLLPLQEQDSRLKVVPLTAAEWDSFDEIEQMGLLNDVETVPWDQGVHPQLQYISHLPVGNFGEQLIAQFLRLIPSQAWLFKYGRVPMNFLLSDYVWQRITSPVSHLTRCKLSVIADATAECSTLLYKQLQPYRDHFHPNPRKADGSVSDTKGGNRRAGVPFLATSIVPLEDQLISAEWSHIWDYCLRRLFVQRATPLKNCLSSLGPGAHSLLPQIEAKVNSNLKIRELTVPEWVEVVQAFAEWPFAPADIGIADAMLDSHSKKQNRR